MFLSTIIKIESIILKCEYLFNSLTKNKIFINSQLNTIRHNVYNTQTKRIFFHF